MVTLFCRVSLTVHDDVFFLNNGSLALSLALTHVSYSINEGIYYIILIRECCHYVHQENLEIHRLI
jgi:hypothetical protein